MVWAKQFGGSGDDTFQEIIATEDGGYALLGYSNSTDGDLEGKDTAVNDYWLLKIDAQGETEWVKTYGGSKDDRGQSLVQTKDGGYALVGYAMSDDGDGSNNEGFHDNWILKLDASGAIAWQYSFGFSGHDHAYDLLETADGGFLFVGFLDVTAANGQGNFGKKDTSGLVRHGVGEFWATKLDKFGNLQWRRYFGGTNNDRAHSVVQADDGGFVMAGFSESDDFDISETKGSYDFWVVKISATGQMVWEKSFGGSGIEIAQDIAKTPDGAYVVTGHTFSTDSDVSKNRGESDLWLIKVSDQGELLWEKTLGGSGFDAGASVFVNKQGEFILAGNSKSTDGDLTENQGENDLWLLKTNATGKVLWQKSFGGNALDFGFDAIQDTTGKLILVGEVQTSFLGNTHYGGKDGVMILVD
jgi:hypothetical protein